MKIVHPDLPGQTGDVAESAYHEVLRHHGWQPAPAPAEAPDVDGLTVAEVLNEVGDDPAKAAAALDAERDSRDRTTLVAALEQIVQPDTNSEE